MTIQEIKAAIVAGKKVCWGSSLFVVTGEQVNPLYELSVRSAKTGLAMPLNSCDYEDCFIVGEG